MFKTNTLNWAILWVYSGAPADPAWWTNCHHVIRAALQPFCKAYSAASEGERSAILDQYGIFQ